MKSYFKVLSRSDSGETQELQIDGTALVLRLSAGQLDPSPAPAASSR